MYNLTYPGFDYSAAELSAYIYSIGLFIIALKPNGVIQYEPHNPELFRDWLRFHGIRDINNEVGTMILDHCFKKR